MRKLADEHAQFDKGGKRLTVSVVYESIKRSNSSLKRKSKKLLEDSIDRVLRVMKEEQDEEDDSESLDGDFEGIDDSGHQVKVRPFGLHLQNLETVILTFAGTQYYE